MTASVLRARRLLPTADRWIEDGGVLVARGRVVRVLTSPAAVRRAVRAGAREHDLGDGVLTPGLVNAHAHLELSGLVGALPRGPDFRAWVQELMRLRASRSARRLAADARAGADQALASGTTCVGDVDSVGASERGLADHPLFTVLFREVLDAQDPSRTAAALRRVARALPRRVGRIEGLAPHAPFSVSPALFAELAGPARRRRLPLSMHWSETEEEVRWLRTGAGSFGAWLGPSPRCSGLELLAAAGLLRAPLALVHGNFPGRGEPARIAAAGAVVVHCPRSHQWFERPPFPLRRYRRAGVPIALGTDSLASNWDLDLHHEAARLAAVEPGLGPRELWRMLTVHGARALGLEGRAGELAPGARADLCLYPADAAGGGGDAFLERVTRGGARPRAVLVGGRRPNRSGARRS